jgi:hypothetical protein
MRRYCADRRSMAPPPTVEMPYGFAPMLGIDGFFVKSAPVAGTAPPVSPPVVESLPPPKVARAEPPPRPSPVPPARNEPVQEFPTKESPATSPPLPQAAIQPPAQVTPPPAPPLAKAPPATAPPVATPGGAVVPKIINRPDAAPAQSSEPPPAAVVSKPPPAPEPKTESRPAAAQNNPVPPEPAVTPPSGGEDAPLTVSLLSVAQSPTAAVVAGGGLAALLLAAFALARRRERVATARPREFASVSLGGKRGGGSLVARPGAPFRRASAAAPMPPPAPAPAMGSASPVALGDRIPQTRAEAMQVLGMGVTPDANEMAMKKIVDGLRLSWHPDLAKDEGDRQLREFRLKQINTAWDLIRGKRMERLDS